MRTAGHTVTDDQSLQEEAQRLTAGFWTPLREEIMIAVYNSLPEQRAWGYHICELIGKPSGSVYPALEKLMEKKLLGVERTLVKTESGAIRRRDYYFVTALGKLSIERRDAVRRPKRLFTSFMQDDVEMVA